MREIAVFGGPGAGAMVVQSLQRLGVAGKGVAVSGLLNDQLAVGTAVAGTPVLGAFDSWRALSAGTAFIAPLHKAKAMQSRAARILSLQIPSERWAKVIDPNALVAGDAEVGDGSYLAPFALVDAGARVGRHAGLWPAAQIGHDCVTDDFVFAGRGAIVCGRCTIGVGCYIGAGAVVSDGLKLGRFCVVGAGAVVVRDVPDHALVAGRPARVIGRLDPRDDPV
jgi:sugar O-acyltransferase (sialic acid O-acetyltransferase NeuD family)